MYFKIMNGKQEAVPLEVNTNRSIQLISLPYQKRNMGYHRFKNRSSTNCITIQSRVRRAKETIYRMYGRRAKILFTELLSRHKIPFCKTCLLMWFIIITVSIC